MSINPEEFIKTTTEALTSLTSNIANLCDHSATLIASTQTVISAKTALISAANFAVETSHVRDFYVLAQHLRPHVITFFSSLDTITPYLVNTSDKQLNELINENLHNIKLWKNMIHQMYNQPIGQPKLSDTERCERATELETNIKGSLELISRKRLEMMKSGKTIALGNLRKNKKSKSKSNSNQVKRKSSKKNKSTKKRKTTKKSKSTKKR